jgi:hypothetical protein
MSENITYLDHVQSLIYDLRKIYNRIGGLRDAAQGNEKDYCNTCRGLLNQADTELQELEREIIENNRYNMKF